MQLSDFAQALGAAQNLVPSYEGMKANALALRGADLQNQMLQRQLVEADTEAAEQQALKVDLQSLGANATPDQYWRLAARHPTLKGISEAAAAMTDAQRRTTVGHAGQIHAALQNNRTDLAKQLVQRSIDASRNSGEQPDQDDVDLLAAINSGDPEQIAAVKGGLYAIIAASNPDTAARNLGEFGNGSADFSQLGSGGIFNQRTGAVVREPYIAPEYKSVGEGETLLEVNPGRGGDPRLGGGGAGGSGPVDRLINSDAGGGYVPDSVKTLGQFVDFGRTLNQRGATSSSAGRYQINGSTMAEFAPRVLGPDWRNVPYTAGSQERVGKAIFDWAKQQPNPAAALKGRWVSLSQAEASRLVKGDWSQARGLIAQKETGGGAGASASAPGGGGARVIAQGAPKRGYSILTPQEVAAIPGLSPNGVYQRGPDGNITSIGGQDKTAPLKPWPAAQAAVVASNRAAIGNIDGAIKLLDPKNNSAEARRARAAIGPGTGALGDTFTQWNNPEGTDARARIGQIGGIIIKDTSGAAVSLSEDSRLAKWVPLVTDKPQVARAKLLNLKRELGSRNSALADTLEELGYRPLEGGPQATAAPPTGFRVLRVRPK